MRLFITALAYLLCFSVFGQNKKEIIQQQEVEITELSNLNSSLQQKVNSLKSEIDHKVTTLQGEIYDLKKELNNYLKYSYNEFKERYAEFKLTQSDETSKQFDELNDYRTSIRGVKVRGVYDTYKEAQIRAKVLQRTDQSHNVFVGQVGYWLPWDPEADKIQSQEYLN